MKAGLHLRSHRGRGVQLHRGGAAAVAVCAIACGPPDVTARVDDYHAQVRAALGETGPPPASPNAERFYPPLRERRIAVGDERIGMVDFVVLQRCRLGTLVARRNSALGKLMGASRRLVYEVEVLLAADDCLDTLEGDRQQRLAEMLDRKRAELRSHVWNAVWTDSELDPYLSWERPPAPDAWDDYAVVALEDLGRAVGSVTPAEEAGALEAARAVESSLAALHRAAPGGGLLRALADVGGRMDAVAVLVEDHGGDVCRDATRRLVRVYQATYPGLESELALLDRRGRTVIESLAALYRETAARVEVPPAMQRYGRERLDVNAETALWPRYQRARQRHAAAWQAPLRACGDAPPA